MKSVAFSRREREIMEIIYALGGATLTEILDRVEKPPTRPALRSILGILETKGHLTHSKRGREFVFQPTQARDEAGRSAMHKLLQTFFDGSVGHAVASYFSDPKAKPSEEELQEIVDQLKQLQKGNQQEKGPQA